MAKLVLIRHGKSEWNKSNQFTGWVDVDLAPEGVEQAKAAGKALKEQGLEFVEIGKLICDNKLKEALDKVIEVGVHVKGVPWPE